MLEILSETQESQILSLTSAGQGGEFLLRYRVTYPSARQRQHETGSHRARSCCSATMTYDDRRCWRRKTSRACCIQDMREDAVRQMVRRLSQARVPPEPAS